MKRASSFISPPATKRSALELPSSPEPSDYDIDIESPPRTPRRYLRATLTTPATRPRKMAKKRYRSSRRYPISDARAQAHEKMLMDQFNPDEARGSSNSIKKYGPTWNSATVAQRKARIEAGYKGRGDYRSILAAGSRGLGYGIGSYFGNGQVGADWGGRFSKWMGWGKYRRRKNYRGRGDYGGDAGGNQIMAGSVDTPITVNASDDLSGDIYISHREFVQNITATGGSGNISPFKLESFSINAGLAQTFPWLAQIAQNFSLYEFLGLIYEFRPTSGELGATGTNALGKLVMATQYDPDAPSFTSTIEMENYDYANSCKPSEHMLHGVETDPKQRPTNLLYVRTGASTKSQIFTDVGDFQIATEGLPVTSGATAIIGELWVTYRVKLSRARLFATQLGSNILFDQFLGVSSTTSLVGNTAAYLSGVTWTADYTVSPAPAFFPYTKNNLGCSVVQNTANQSVKIIFPSSVTFGVFRVSYEITPSAASTISFNNPTFNGNVALKVYNGVDGEPAAQSFTTSISAATANVCQIVTVGVTAAPPTAGANYMILSFVAADASNNKLQSITITQIPAL